MIKHDPKKCSAYVCANDRSLAVWQCKRLGKYEEDGKLYCKTHLPSEIKKREAAAMLRAEKRFDGIYRSPNREIRRLKEDLAAAKAEIELLKEQISYEQERNLNNVGIAAEQIKDMQDAFRPFVEMGDITLEMEKKAEEFLRGDS